MTQVAAAVENPLTQLAGQCRDQPVVFDGVRPELCPALEQIILGRMQSDRGRRVGSINVGGWKSGEDFFTWSDAAVQDLRRSIVEIVGATKSLVGWAMVNRAGSKHPRHQHRAAILAGVYYVAAGSPELITPTMFECPCDGRAARPADRYELAVDPHPGRAVLCRGETWHHVPAYTGDLPRITIAFDVRR
jgi:Putative 2OG-Fe(II) oxygenase